MPIEVDKKPTYSELGKFCVAQDVAGQHIERWDHSALFLNAFNTEHVVSTYLNPLSSSAVFVSSSTNLQYWKSPYANLIGITAELQTSTGTALRSAYVDVNLPAGAAWVGDSPFDGTVSGESRQITYPRNDTVRVQSFTGYVDVSNCVSTSILDFSITASNYSNALSGNVGQGFYGLNIFEAPLNMANPVSSADKEPGFDIGWSRSGEFLYAGHPGLSYGFVRTVNQLEKARSQQRKHWQVATHIDANRCFIGNAGSNVNLNYQSKASGDKRYGYIKTRDLYADFNVDYVSPYKLRIWYRTTSALGTYKLTLNVRAYGLGGSYISYDLSCPASLTWTTAVVDVDLPTDGTNNEAEFYFTTTVSANQLQICNIALIENEA